jgi:SAM-dependent methyltransferase
MAEFDRYTDDYNVMLDESLAPLGGFDDYYLHRKVALLENSVQKADVRSVLDFGCGLGGTTLMLQKAFTDARVVGVDISEKSIEQAKLHSPGIEFGCISDDVFMASCSGTFDLVYVANVFHHVPLIERTIVMSTMKSMLAPNGKVFFFEHNPYNPITKWVVSRCEFDRDAILLTPRESRSLFERSGFNVDRTMYLLFFPHLLRFLSKIESSLKWLPLGAQYCVAASCK